LKDYRCRHLSEHGCASGARLWRTADASFPQSDILEIVSKISR
jgi:hypothetical protein